MVRTVGHSLATVVIAEEYVHGVCTWSVYTEETKERLIQQGPLMSGVEL